jgi:hypothetical protein
MGNLFMARPLERMLAMLWVSPNRQSAIPACSGKLSVLTKINFGKPTVCSNSQNAGFPRDFPRIRIPHTFVNVNQSGWQCPEEWLMAPRAREISEPIARREIWTRHYTGHDREIHARVVELWRQLGDQNCNTDKCQVS